MDHSIVQEFLGDSSNYSPIRQEDYYTLHDDYMIIYMHL